MRIEQQEVAEFHHKFGFPNNRDLREEPDGVFPSGFGKGLLIMAEGLIPLAVQQGDAGDERMRRCQLMLEELGEVINALDDKDPLELADALGDLLYVVLGTGETYGIPCEEVFTAIHASNMSKTRATDDSRMKRKDPALGYFKPDVRSILRDSSQYGSV